MMVTAQLFGGPGDGRQLRLLEDTPRIQIPVFCDDGLGAFNYRKATPQQRARLFEDIDWEPTIVPYVPEAD